jgi:hypothetical protein
VSLSSGIPQACDVEIPMPGNVALQSVFQNNESVPQNERWIVLGGKWVGVGEEVDYKGENWKVDFIGVDCAALLSRKHKTLWQRFFGGEGTTITATVVGGVHIGGPRPILDVPKDILGDNS